jgi:hypothetical protein
MELPVEPSSQPPRGRNYERAPWCYLLWAVPAGFATLATYAYDRNLITSLATEILWVTAVAWIGVGCFINGRSCGRVHCRIDGVLFPALSVLGALNILNLISFSWNLFWLVAFAGLVVSFVPEWTWKRYS